MPQQTSPWLEGAYGWAFGEDNWNSGMDQNLLKFSFMFDKNIDSIVASLPPAVNGQAHFNTTDNRIYFAIGSTYYSTPVPKWFQLQVKNTGDTYQFDGLSLNQVDSSLEIDNRLDAIEVTLDTLGSAAFEDVEFFATQANLDVVEASANQYTDDLRADLQSISDINKGASILGWLRNALGAVGVNFGKYLGWQPVSVLDFMTDAQRDDVLNGTGALDLSVPLQAARDYIASSTLNRQLVFPAGVYAYSVSPNWAIQDAEITAQGEVRLRYTGVGNAVIIDAGAGAQTCFNLKMGRFIVEAPPTGGHGVYVRSIHESDLSFFVPTAGASSAGIRVDFAVLTTFRKPTVTSNVVSFYGAAPPQYGVYLNERNPGETVSYCLFEGISCAGSPVGLHLEKTLGNIFLGGALQACTTRGMETSSSALRDKFYGLDFEANGIRDIVCLGRQMEFYGCDTTLSVFLAGSNNRLMGGNHETIEIDASGVQNSLGGGLLYRRNDTGSLVDNGQQTNMRDLVRVDVGGSTFTRHNSVPNRLTPSVGASPFTYTNTTGNDMTVSISGGTVSSLVISRPGFPGTATGATSGTFLLSPKDAIVITYSVAPALIVLSR